MLLSFFVYFEFNILQRFLRRISFFIEFFRIKIVFYDLFIKNRKFVSPIVVIIQMFPIFGGCKKVLKFKFVF